MKDDFEQFVITKLMEISDRISRLEGKAIVWGAVAGGIMAGLGEVIARSIWHQ
jgi:hypothetical protein